MWCWRRLFRVPWTLSKKMEPINPKGNQPWIYIGRTDAEAPILWPPDAKNWLTGKDRDARKDWEQEKNGVTEDEIVGWHHWLNGRESEQTLEDGGGQGDMVCCSPWSHRVTHDLATEHQFLVDEGRSCLPPEGCGGEAGRALLRFLQANRFQKTLEIDFSWCNHNMTTPHKC